MSERCNASFVVDPPTGARLPHYLAATIVVGIAVGTAVYTLARVAVPDTFTETEDTVFVDLPPVDAGPGAQGDDAPVQQAAAPSTGAQSDPVSKPADEDVPRTSSTDEPEAAPKAPAPAAVVETPASAPPRTASSAAAPQDAHEAGGRQHAPATNVDDAETRRTSAHLITLWQKALMARLHAARHGLPHPDHAAGIVRVAFEIDHDGRLVSEHVATGSGSTALDAAALALVRRAAPYPRPPGAAGSSQLSFVVPISFRR